MECLKEAEVVLIFGSDTGNTEEVGGKIVNQLADFGCNVEMVEVTEASTELLEVFDYIIMGIPTWDFGGIQEDWEEFEEALLAADMQGKVVALYGLGDQFGYADYFVDAMGWLNERVLKTGARVVGSWSTEGYDFTESLACDADKTRFCGLAVDDDQQFDLTDERVAQWVLQITEEFKQLAAA